MLIHRPPPSTPGAFGDIPYGDRFFVLAGTPIEVILGSVKENIDFALIPVPAFADVPCTGGFAGDWIEELAARGITAGCGGGNYCPQKPVTRAEMAVFLVKTFSLP